jgi:FkbM family methyltransferase
MRIAKKHFVYAADMSDRFEMYFSPVLPRETEDGKQVVDYSTPRLQTYKSNGLQFELASFPEEDEAVESYFRWYRPKDGDLVFDIGAHCGVSTYHFSTLVGPSGRVIAFEPDPLHHSLLLRNVERHQLSNVTVVDAAIASTAGFAMFQAEGTIGSNLASVSSRDTVGSTMQVRTMTLAHAFSQYGKPDLCKIDIEGAEIAVLNASRDLLKLAKTNFVLDTNHMVDGALTTQRVEDIFCQCGFECESLGKIATTWAR